jgi:hypothetical protein
LWVTGDGEDDECGFGDCPVAVCANVILPMAGRLYSVNHTSPPGPVVTPSIVLGVELDAYSVYMPEGVSLTRSVLPPIQRLPSGPAPIDSNNDAFALYTTTLPSTPSFPATAAL